MVLAKPDVSVTLPLPLFALHQQAGAEKAKAPAPVGAEAISTEVRLSELHRYISILYDVL